MNDEQIHGTTISLIAVSGIAIAIGAGFAVHALQIQDTKVFGVAEANANRDVYENTKAYRDGVQRDMDELVLSYHQTKTPQEKAAIVSVMRHRAEGVPASLMTAEAMAILGGAQ